MLPPGRAGEILELKDPEVAQRWCDEHGYCESWAIIDGVVVVYNLDDPPNWLALPLACRDDDGNTPLGEGSHRDLAKAKRNPEQPEHLSVWRDS